MSTKHDDMPDTTAGSLKTSQDSLSSTPGIHSLVYRDMHFVETNFVADDESSSAEAPVIVDAAPQLQRLHDDLHTILDNDVDDAYASFLAEAEACKVDQMRDQCRGEQQQDFWSSAIDRTYERAVREKWTQEDLHAALIQGSLLSYRSHEFAARNFGCCYIDSAPEDYAHNCPWNDWTPPSESLRLFRDAAAATPRRLDGVARRVRVHVHVSSSATCPGMIAFASRELNAAGKEALVVRRGQDILASLILRKICITSDLEDRRLIMMTVATRSRIAPSPKIYLRFENDKRLESFKGLLRLAGSSRD
jgi:hypothetical protein